MLNFLCSHFYGIKLDRTLSNPNKDKSMKNHVSLLMIAAISILITSSCGKEDPDDRIDRNLPHACFVAPTEVSAGTPAIFNSSCSENSTSFSWNFGDGGSSSDANPSHTYTEAGSFNVVLTVTASEGETDQMTISVVVLAPEFFEHSDPYDQQCS